MSPLRDADSLNEKILELHRNPDACVAMGRAAKQRVSTGCTWDDCGRRKLETYESLLARPRGGRAATRREADPQATPLRWS